MPPDRRTRIVQFVQQVHSALDSMDYYQLLRISSAADEEQIRKAYYALATSLHPDVHGVDTAPQFRKELTAVFSRIAEAYKVLVNPENRARYDRELAGGHLRISMGADVRQTGPHIATPSARRFFQLGMEARNAGDRASAAMNFRFALQVEPDNAEIQRELALAEMKPE